MTRALPSLLAVAAVLWFTGATAQARTIIECDSCSYPYQQWVDEAKVPTPNVTLTVVGDVSPCEGAGGCTEEGADTIWFAGSGGRQGFYHELGHNFDYSMPAWARARYLAILGRSGPWRRQSYNQSPNEFFADSYALCAFKLWIPLGGEVQDQKPVGGRSVHNRTCRLIRHVAVV